MAAKIASSVAVCGLYFSQQKRLAMSDDIGAARQGVCIMNSEKGETGFGIVKFKQQGVYSPTEISGEFTGLTPNHKHGFHIHQFGNLVEGCKTAGPHYNPFSLTHGGPQDRERHVGDLGNVQADAEGKSQFFLVDS